VTRGGSPCGLASTAGSSPAGVRPHKRGHAAHDSCHRLQLLLLLVLILLLLLLVLVVVLPVLVLLVLAGSLRSLVQAQ